MKSTKINFVAPRHVKPNYQTASTMACLQKHSPALMEILLSRLQSIDTASKMDHHLYEYGAVKYHIQASGLNPKIIQLSISVAPLSPFVRIAKDLSTDVIREIRELCADLVEIVEPTEEGYQLTLRFDFSRFPANKEESMKLIKSISSLRTTILASQLRDMLRNEKNLKGISRPIKIAYHPREYFFIVRQAEKTTVIFPMHFKDDLDVVIATALFQAVMDMRCTTNWKKAPFCTWSPIPPRELRGEHIKDLITNGGFVSFEILPCHTEREKIDKTIWSLLNFCAYVKRHVKHSKGFIGRQMNSRLDCMVKVLQCAKNVGKEHKPNRGCKQMRNLINISKSKRIKRSCTLFKSKLKKRRMRIKIHGFAQLRRRWMKIMKFTSSRKFE
ncbi:actin-related protein 2/3 complex subunit 2B-like isoform X2 [Nymphaea colorata]|uniref:actin-related protein 2/3 complex subunit 2B-like isoform X2 n=1 Tax=Nymphaea colorata TaxID=210225 RepID=UPI00129DE4D8|nr:actin-related protein 2/3 complex subunit 2B-like isoform X2 [Nymphaea colorata]